MLHSLVISCLLLVVFVLASPFPQDSIEASRLYIKKQSGHEKRYNDVDDGTSPAQGFPGIPMDETDVEASLINLSSPTSSQNSLLVANVPSISDESGFDSINPDPNDSSDIADCRPGGGNFQKRGVPQADQDFCRVKKGPTSEHRGTGAQPVTPTYPKKENGQPVPNGKKTSILDENPCSEFWGFPERNLYLKCGGPKIGILEDPSIVLNCVPGSSSSPSINAFIGF